MLLLSCPYYLLGGLIAGLVAAASREGRWQPPLMILTVMALGHLFYRFYLRALNHGNQDANALEHA